MRLHQHPDFAAFVTATAAEHDLREQFVEKDYWITEILRTIATTLPDRAIFKGGTSLSKGWGLLDRFSEDIDLFVDPAVDPPLARRAIDRTLKRLRDDVAAIDGLQLQETQTIGGFGRIDTFAYTTHFEGIAGFPATLRLEPGIQSGKQPTEDVALTSLVAALLTDRGASDELTDVEGLGPFTMTLLHFRRTFVEKLFALHGKIERLVTEAHPLGRDARHYADLYALAATPEVDAMLRSEEYAAIKADYDTKSREYFPRSYRPPDNLSFAASTALFPSGELRHVIEADYERECARLFYGPHPPFADVLKRLQALRDLL
ncbi:MAG: nucleotidyl transferase AbiEii/AbiGii toxin family protein [Baekduia sp.]